MTSRTSSSRRQRRKTLGKKDRQRSTNPVVEISNFSALNLSRRPSFLFESPRRSLSSLKTEHDMHPYGTAILCSKRLVFSYPLEMCLESADAGICHSHRSGELGCQRSISPHKVCFLFLRVSVTYPPQTSPPTRLKLTISKHRDPSTPNMCFFSPFYTNFSLELSTRFVSSQIISAVHERTAARPVRATISVFPVASFQASRRVSRSKPSSLLTVR